MADEENKKSIMSLTEGNGLSCTDLQKGERNRLKRKFSVSFTLEKGVRCRSVDSRWGVEYKF